MIFFSCEKLANELHLKESLWEEKEQHLQERLADSKRTIKKLEEDLETAVKEAKEKSQGPSSMDMVELKGKLRMAETNAKTLRIELDSAQKEVLARNKVNDAKDALINMQDKKIEQQKKHLALLQKTVEEYRSQKEITYNFFVFSPQRYLLQFLQSSSVWLIICFRIFYVQ